MSRVLITPRLRSAGDSAVLLELANSTQRRLLHSALLRDPAPGAIELVPAAVTILLRAATPDGLPAILDHLRAMLAAGIEDVAQDEVTPIVIGVRYDGEDLAGVAKILGITPAEVVARHTGQLWTVEFAGFMPGFGYMVGAGGGLVVPRLTSPRTRIPPGSVALAGEFTGIYPQASPGGWQLIGTTDFVLWDEDATPPTVMVPGNRIQFQEVR